jgi:hypothetical protein
MFGSRDNVEAGGLMSYAADLGGTFERSKPASSDLV